MGRGYSFMMPVHVKPLLANLLAFMAKEKGTTRSALVREIIVRGINAEPELQSLMRQYKLLLAATPPESAPR